MKSSVFDVHAAFERLVRSPYYWRKTGRPMAQRRALVYKLNQNMGISLDEKRKLLLEGGFRIAQSETWTYPEIAAGSEERSNGPIMRPSSPSSM